MNAQPQTQMQSTDLNPKVDHEGLRAVLAQTNDALSNAQSRLETILGLLDDRDSSPREETHPPSQGVTSQMFLARTQAQSIHLLLDALERLI